jgi:hypothetical protein
MNRLRALVWKYDAGARPGSDGADLSAATADEMFALLDRELGS